MATDKDIDQNESMKQFLSDYMKFRQFFTEMDRAAKNPWVWVGILSVLAAIILLPVFGLMIYNHFFAG